MADQYQEALFAAIDVLAKDAVNQIATDKTIKATIVSCTNAITNEYKVSYEGGNMYAYGQDNTSYSENSSVYVLVPEGNFNNKKIILGKANLSGDDANISFVSSTLNNYNLIGQNTIIDENKILPLGLFSYLKEDKYLLYKYGEQDSSMLKINAEELNTYIKESEALLIEAKFQTRLPKEHRVSKTGHYGLEFVLAFKNTDATANQYDTYLPQIEEIDSDKPELGKENSKQALERLWSNQLIPIANKKAEVLILISHLEKYKSTYENELSETTISIIDLCLDKMEEISNVDSIEDGNEILDTMNQEEQPEIKYLSYTLDSTRMLGNPFLFNNYANQYEIFPIDVNNFLYIDNIIAYSEGFVDVSEPYNQWGDDIFIDEIEIFGLKTITAINGDYKLEINAPKGTIFKTLKENETLEIIGRVTYQNNIELSDMTNYYWFREDGRITAASEYYQMYGGVGWKWLKDDSNKYTLTIKDSDNQAYENRYICVAVYSEEIVLKEEFIVYNEAAKRDITIESDLGLRFSFDRGTPTLTCLINGKSHNFEEDNEINQRPDDYFSFYWSKIDEYGQTTVFNQTYEEAKAAYEEALNNIEAVGGSTAIIALRNTMMSLEGVEFEKNVLKYPVKGIDKSATFKCSVFVKDLETSDSYSIGSAQISLQNELAATPNDYYIMITNGDQVFQYSETGIAPDHERYTDPLEIKPLSCHFYDPAGLEVNTKTYTVTWKVPLEDSLIVVPSEGMVTNPATGKDEYYPLKEFPLQIKENYDSQALNNQITAIVNYDGLEYMMDTTFLFTKVGENGTNGTDVVCKIEPVHIPQDTLLALEVVQPSGSAFDVIQGWNNGYDISNCGFQFKAYNRGEPILLDKSVKWDTCGGSSRNKRLTVTSDVEEKDIGFISWATSDAKDSLWSNQIIKGQVDIEDQRYYAFYPLPVIRYYNAYPAEQIKIDKTKTLKSILYNADGKNPIYNKNQGVFLSFSNSKEKYFIWESIGGKNDNQINDSISTSSLRIMTTKNGRFEDGSTEEPVYRIFQKGLDYIYIMPDDSYSGEYANNNIVVTIYTDENSYLTGKRPEAQIIIPIYMSLNKYGLASLNQWDGNHIEINEDNNYILAPQIGAGIKDATSDESNTFTGIVMGVASNYTVDEIKSGEDGTIDYAESDEDDYNGPKIGLLGYCKGEQSIYLNCQTGSATFGLPELSPTNANRYTEGRIKLIPGGTSEIGMWKIGSRFLYNIPDGMFKIDSRYSGDYVPEGSVCSIPHETQGILLNSDPTYISVKGRPLTNDDDVYFAPGSGAERIDGKSQLYLGDSLEIQLDPNQSSIFSVLQHTKKDGDWVRQLRVGIDYYGRFFTNSLKNNAVGVSPGPVSAFGKTIIDNYYSGLSVEKGEDVQYAETLVKFFTEKDGRSDSTLYISGSNDFDDDYARPIAIYGNSISLYSNYNSTSKTSPYKITISPSNAYIGSSTNYLTLGSTNSLNTNANYTESIGGNKTENITGYGSCNFGSYLSLVTGGNITITGGDSRNAANLNCTIYGTTSLNTSKNLSLISNSGNNSFTSSSVGMEMITPGKISFYADENKSALTLQNKQVYSRVSRITGTEAASISLFNFLEGGNGSNGTSTGTSVLIKGIYETTSEGVETTPYISIGRKIPEGKNTIQDVIDLYSTGQIWIKASAIKGVGNMSLESGNTFYVNNINSTENSPTQNGSGVINITPNIRTEDIYITSRNQWLAYFIDEYNTHTHDLYVPERYAPVYVSGDEIKSLVHIETRYDGQGDEIGDRPASLPSGYYYSVSADPYTGTAKVEGGTYTTGGPK